MTRTSYVEVDGVRYGHVGALAEAFRAQVDVSIFEDNQKAGDVVDYTRARRDQFLRAMPPRDRWLLIQACLALATETALVQESRS